jgi:hypothetical protein
VAQAKPLIFRPDIVRDIEEQWGIKKMPTIDSEHKVEYAGQEKLSSGDTMIRLIVKHPFPDAPAPERMPARAKLCFQKVFCSDWRFSERMFEALWTDFEAELKSKEAANVP